MVFTQIEKKFHESLNNNNTKNSHKKYNTSKKFDSVFIINILDVKLYNTFIYIYISYK
jgi:hypothetical protein